MTHLWLQIRQALQLLVVQRFGERMTSHRIHAERPHRNWQDLIVVLHEFGQVEQSLHRFHRHRCRRESRFNRANELFLLSTSAGTQNDEGVWTHLIDIIELAPDRDKGRIEEIARQRLIHLCQTRTRSQRMRRRRLKQLNAQSLHPLSPILLLRSIGCLPGRFEVLLIDR